MEKTNKNYIEMAEWHIKIQKWKRKYIKMQIIAKKSNFLPLMNHIVESVIKSYKIVKSQKLAFRFKFDRRFFRWKIDEIDN